MSKCDKCGAKIINDCTRCGAPQCCPKCCANSAALSNSVETELVNAYFALFPGFAWSGPSEAIGVIVRHASELRAERDKLIELIGQSLSECVSDAGSDDPKIHPPEMSLLCRWNDAIGQTGKLPMECIRCGEPSGPLSLVDDDSPGYICGECYAAMHDEPTNRY